MPVTETVLLLFVAERGRMSYLACARVSKMAEAAGLSCE